MSPQVDDHFRQRLAVDQLHGVVVHAPLAADGVHRDDVLVVQVCRRVRLDAEPVQLLRVHGGGVGQDLERHPPPQGPLLRLVHHAHPALAQLPNQPEVPELLVRRWAGMFAALGRLGRRGQGGRRPERRQEARQPLGVLRVGGQDGRHVHRLPGLQPLGQLLDQVS